MWKRKRVRIARRSVCGKRREYSRRYFRQPKDLPMWQRASSRAYQVYRSEIDRNAEKLWDNEIADDKVVAIEFKGRIAVNEITSLEIRKIMNVLGTERTE